MKTLTRVSLILVLAFFALGNRGCTTTDTVILPEGPTAAELGRAKDEQIAALKKQVTDTETQRAADTALAAQAASNVKGIVKAHEYLPPTPAKEAIGEESKLALDRLPDDDPAETVKALERVVMLITGQRDEALKLYREESDAAKAAKREIAVRDEALVASKAVVVEREQTIARLEREKVAEAAKHANDVKAALAKKDADIIQLKKDYADKQQQLWLLGIRAIGLFFILAGGIAIIVFKLVKEGAAGIGLGLIIGIVSVGFDKLVSAPWFPAAFGALVLGGLIAGGVATYRMWKKHQLGEKKTQAIQDMIDEATVKGDTKAVEELKAHLTYRMGGKDTYWGKAQAEEVVALGLVDPKGEAALKEAPKS